MSQGWKCYNVWVSIQDKIGLGTKSLERKLG